MLDCLGKSGESAKRAYTSMLDFAAVPFVYATWYNERLFTKPTWFSYAYLATGVFSYAIKEMSHQYKLANPLLTPEQHHKIVRIIDSCFQSISSATEIIFPAIVLDVIYQIKDIFSKEALTIIHPIFIASAVSYGVYKGLEFYGVFKPQKQKVKVDALEASNSGDIVWNRIERNEQMNPNEFTKITSINNGDVNEGNLGFPYYGGRSL